MSFQVLLTRWNASLIEDDAIEDLVGSEVLKNGWLGRPPASEQALEAAERRFGISLPSSYKEFLRVSNGWAYPGNELDFPGPLRSVDSICWFRDEDLDWIETWAAGGQPDSSDEDYFIYGEEQNPVTLRVGYLRHCLKISDVTEGGVYLLNPKIQRADGEWEAWHFSNELPGATRCPSFFELIQQQHAQFLRYRDDG